MSGQAGMGEERRGAPNCGARGRGRPPERHHLIRLLSGPVHLAVRAIRAGPVGALGALGSNRGSAAATSASDSSGA